MAVVTCSNCRRREARHQTAMNMSGRLVYMSLCDKCFEDLRKRSQSTDSLDRFSRDLTDEARNQNLDPVIGRDAEIARVVHILSRRKKNNPVLIGEPGVGKTAIVEGLAQKIVQNTVPEPLRKRRLVALDLAAMISGTMHRGAFEKRLKEVVEEVIKTKGQVILFVDEVHTLVGSGSAHGSMDAANILKPYLARGVLQLVGATTLKEYRLVEKDAALERRFQQIIVNEPTQEHTERILHGLRKQYEDHHKIKISAEAIDSAVKLSSRYISDRYLPDKAIDLVDEAGAGLRLQLSEEEPENLREVLSEIEGLEMQISREKDQLRIKKLAERLSSLTKVKNELTELWVQTKLESIPTLTTEHIAAVVSRSTGIPLNELTQGERKRLQSLESRIGKIVVGQKEAVKVVSQSIRRARAGVKSLDRPIGVFMLLGPTGVGKTELAKALAQVLYGSDDYLIRVDMSEFNERHNVSRLIGSPPGYVGYDEGGQLTEKVRRKPFSVVLFDEIEKAHPEVFNSLLQVMDEGRLTDGHGRLVDFKNTVIIMTSNVGSEYLKKGKIGFTELDINSDLGNEVDAAHKKISDRLQSSLRDSFKPEFLNRIDEIVIFKPLSRREIGKIVDIQIKELSQLLGESKIEIKLTKKAKKYLVERGYNIEMGARPLKRVIRKDVENRISEMIINGDVGDGGTVIVDTDRNGTVITVKVMSKVKVPAS